MVRLAVVVWALSVLGASCATVPPAVLRGSVARDDKKLDEAVEAFYRATSASELRGAAQAALEAGPDSGKAHEVAATLAEFLGDEAGVWRHLRAALLDTSYDTPLLALHKLAALQPTVADRPGVRALYVALAQGHPRPDVRAAAAHVAVAMLAADGDFALRDEVLASIPGVLPLQVVGTWDNDQGKAFDLDLEPEGRPGVEETYTGTLGPLRWRPGVTDARGRLDLLSQMTPSRWSAAFARGEVVTQEGQHELRLTSSDPLKVWVDGKLVFAAAQLERSVFDHVVVPLRLAAGKHVVLVKSAHREGAWHLVVRLVAAPQALPGAATSLEAALEAPFKSRGSAEARTRSHRVAWAHLAAGGPQTVKLADAYAQAYPQSVVARVQQVDALWYNQERGRTSDAVLALDQAHGAELPFVRLRQVRFDLQQGLRQRARPKLMELTRKHPEVREGWDLLIDLYRAEAWTEDEAATHRELHRRFGATPEELGEYARALLRLGKRREALAVYRQALDSVPFHGDTLRRLADLSLDSGDLEGARWWLGRRLASWPTDTASWLLLAEVHKRASDRPAAEAALEKAIALQPDGAAPFVKRGELAYEASDTARAIEAWRKALALNPENEGLANRLDFLSPEARGAWMADVPELATLEAIVASRTGLKQERGADVAMLLDHQVTLLGNDGSTTNIVSMVVHAFNAAGRDRIIRQPVAQGRLRVLHAYSVDEKGQRTEASSERSRQIFFRGMQPGSTLVLQYRTDAPPKGYLSRYLTEQWSFQGAAEQRAESTFILWAPQGTTLHEAQVGTVQRSEERRGEQLRFQWTARQVAPLIAEPMMPSAQELAANVRVSTVPDWKTWLSWEQALLEGVFQDSPELDAVADKLSREATTPADRLKKLHAYVMEEIRYQQDYESFIAGVKPHAAPMVLERRYGDCKDKAVLFIQLAKKLGLQAHFALVRTRDAGPTNPDVPMQQFNHAIVYVPAQLGVPEARFFDPTAELLDVDAVRFDDVGTRSLVFDPTSGQHTWREIPFQGPEYNRSREVLSLKLDGQGTARGTLLSEAVGRGGSMLRKVALNGELMNQSLQRMAAQYFPAASTSNATVVEARNLWQPAVLQVDVEARAVAREEAGALRMKVPNRFNPQGLFNLTERRHPLVLGAPSMSQTEVKLELPAGWSLARAPAAGAVELPCLTVKREVKQEGQSLLATTTVVTRCERIAPKDYPLYRERSDALVRLLDDELVLAPATPGKRPAPRAGAAAAAR